MQRPTLHRRIKPILFIPSLSPCLPLLHLLLLILAQDEILILNRLFLRGSSDASRLCVVFGYRRGGGGTVNGILAFLGCVDEADVLAEDSEEHCATLFLGKHEVDGVQGTPEGENHSLSEMCC